LLSHGARLLWLPRADLVEPHARGFHLFERLLLQLDRRRSFGGARERAPGDRPVVRALRALQRIERGGVLVLPLEPARQPLDRLGFRRARAVDAKAIAAAGALGMREPSAVSPVNDDAIRHA